MRRSVLGCAANRMSGARYLILYQIRYDRPGAETVFVGVCGVILPGANTAHTA